MVQFSTIFVASVAMASGFVSAAPTELTARATFTLQNGKDALKLNEGFKKLSADSPCTDGQDACIDGKFAACSGGKFLITPCGAGTQCFALPLVNKPGTSVTCDTAADFKVRIAATGAKRSLESLENPLESRAVFTLQNGKDALKLNEGFKKLTENSPCKDGEDACINGKFASCSGGKFLTTACGAGTQCFALPLVNKPGTSVTCDTAADSQARIAATGAKRSLDSLEGSLESRAAFTLQNGKDALKLNASFKKLSANSPCKDGENACIDGKFAACSGGKFLLSACGAGTQCFALPLVNKPGTSVTCDTAADFKARIAATGAKRSLDSLENSLESRAAFTLQNGKDALKLNEGFKKLSAGSPCKDGENACIDGKFAACSGGKFLLSACGAGTQCFALPLVNKPGTSVTCDTAADFKVRIAATGAKRSIESLESPLESRAAFTLQNGKDALKLNAGFKKLSANSPCKDGQDACINGKFAACSGGKFLTTPCGAGLQCFALPLVNKPGTSVTCDTAADFKARIAATGA